MSSWAERAKVRFTQECQKPTPKTTETPLLGVMGVLSGGFCENTDRVLGVMGAPFGDMPEKSHFDLTAANDPQPDPEDVGCWPDSSAMNGAEIDIFSKRVDLFFYKNLPLPKAESLADLLVKRDRDGDDRRVCLECKHLADIGHGWRCNNWQAAGVAVRQRDNQMPADLVLQLQRCDGFAETTLTVYTF